MRTYLIIEDNNDHRQTWPFAIERFDPTARILWANTLEDAKRLFEDNVDEIAFIAMDLWLDRDETVNTVEFTREIRQGGWTGYILGTSSDPDGQSKQLAAGCTQAFLKERFVSALSQFVEQTSALAA